MKSTARVVIIGGGIMGVSLLYHLTKEGWSDVVLVEKGELTSGSTWHAAAFVPHFYGDLNLARVHQYGADLYQSLELETGQATGWHGCGTIRLATNRDEVDYLRYVKGTLDNVGSECHLIGPDEIRKLHPLVNTQDIPLGAYTPNDGYTDPASSTSAMAIGARLGGASIYRHTRVLDTRQCTNGEWEVITDKGNVVCEHLVNAAGCFAVQVGAWVGLKVPQTSMVNHYVVTENITEIEALDKELPTMRDPRASCYIRQEQKGLLVGPYENVGAQAWGLDGIDWSFDMELLAPDLDRLIPNLDLAMERIPAFAKVGIKRVVCGPITHTPDGKFLAGPAAGLTNYWLCCGTAIGITQGPGAGKYLAQWIVHGTTEINMCGLDPRRFGDYLAGDHGIAKSIDDYQNFFQVPYPNEYREAGRPIITTPLYGLLRSHGGVYAETRGWEQPQWFDTHGLGEQYSFRRTKAHVAVAAECRAMHESAGVADLTACAKYDVRGADAERFLNRLCVNDVPSRPGDTVIAYMLGADGGVASEVAVTRISEEHFFLVSGISIEQQLLDWMNRQKERTEMVALDNVTNNYGLLSVRGPRSTELLAHLTDTSLETTDSRWWQNQHIRLADIPLHELRISNIDDVVWQLYHPMNNMMKLYTAIWNVGRDFEIADVGLRAINSMRMENAIPSWGTELTTQVTPVEAGFLNCVNLDKEFIGRDAFCAHSNEALQKQLVHCVVDATDADCLGNEPVYDGDRHIGIVTSGAYGHIKNYSVAFAYVQPGYAKLGTVFEIVVLGERVMATVQGLPKYEHSAVRL